MSEKRIYRLVHLEARRRAAQDCMNARDGDIATISEPTRTLDQNAAQWPILDAFAKQKQLMVNGKMEYVTDMEWKDVLTAAFNEELNRVAHWKGRMVLLGQRTSKFGKAKFSDWLEFLHAAAAEEGVVVYPNDAPREVVDVETGEITGVAA
ncbi:MAG: recombination protein NinB [Ramlibacter sp.]|nr:recombination protein NinB [Ramlibacter sp.]